MDVVTDLGAFRRPSRGSVVTIGAYDGVHLGHQALFRRVLAMARERHCDSTIVTFDRHPATVVRPQSAPLLLTDTEQKLELLAATGVDRTVVIPFDEERSREQAEDFVTEVLVDGVGARAVVVGSDFRFGHGGRGNVELMRRMGSEHGFEVVGIELVPGDGDAGAVPVSSTRIRSLLAAGEVEAAAALLGRPHEVRGVVVHGDGRGRDLGFPTANIAVPAGILLPADGIYAGWYERPPAGATPGGVHPAAVSVGRRPTFYDELGTPVVEAYLLDFDEDLYGERAKVRFTTRLRGDQERFASVDELVAQMAKDVTAARAALA
jgi:riboflavin kinase/FMN adenylyltransferase